MVALYGRGEILNLGIVVRDMGAGKVCPLGEKMGGNVVS